MSGNFRRLYSDPMYVRAQHVGYSVRMVAEIAAHYNEALDASDFRLARCMLDAFYVHIRLVADRRVPSGDDASAFIVDGAHFRQLAGDAVGLFSAFVDAMAATTPEWTRAAGALIPNPDTDPEGWLGRARAEALRELRDSLAEAKADLAS